MLTHPHCKINVGLHVVARRPDGYHDLETLFVPVPLCDDLEIEPSDTFHFQQSGIAIAGPTDDNLCVRAWRLLQQRFPQVGNVRICLHKRVPFGAGLGGGSSDAAFTLRMLNALFQLGLSRDDLLPLASQLGADCPFFLFDTPAYATGIGDRLEPLACRLEGCRVVLLKPTESVSTAEAYRRVVPRAVRPDTTPCDLRQVVQMPVATWRDVVVNDFEASVFPTHPTIAHLKSQLYAAGALYASMSGSGSAVFGLFPKDASVVLPPLPPDTFVWGV